MWYLYLRRDQHYLRSYRTHNLWLDTYAKKMRSPKITSMHVSILKRLSKSVSGVSDNLYNSRTPAKLLLSRRLRLYISTASSHQ